MWLVGRYGGRNHVCNIWWLSVKGCGCGERGKFAFSHWLDASPLQHWSHYRVTVWCRSFFLSDDTARGLSRHPSRTVNSWPPEMWVWSHEALYSRGYHSAKLDRLDHLHPLTRWPRPQRLSHHLVYRPECESTWPYKIRPTRRQCWAAVCGLVHQDRPAIRPE